LSRKRPSPSAVATSASRASVEELRERGGVEPVQDQHLRAGQQSRVQLEARILRGRADQHYRAVLDIGQEAVLLRAIEAVDLVHEQQSLFPDPHMVERLCEHLLEIRNPGKDRRNGDKAHADRIGE